MLCNKCGEEMQERSTCVHDTVETINSTEHHYH